MGDSTLPGSDPPEDQDHEALPTAGGLREQLRRQREELLKDRTKKLDIAGYGGLLVAEYRTIPWDRVQALSKKISKMPEDAQTLVAAADTIINACVGIYGRDGDQLRPLYDIYPEVEQEGIPVKYDERLIVALDLDMPEDPKLRSARHILIKTFNNNIAVIDHASLLSDWMKDTTQDSDEEFLGESPGTRQ